MSIDIGTYSTYSHGYFHLEQCWVGFCKLNKTHNTLIHHDYLIVIFGMSSY